MASGQRKNSLRDLCKSLSARLLTLTAIWVSFVCGCIIYTMVLGWSIDRTAEMVNRVTSMPVQIYRANSMTSPNFLDSEFEHQLNSFARTLATLKMDSDWSFAGEERRDRIFAALEVISREWQDNIRPKLEQGRKEALSVNGSDVDGFVVRLNELVDVLNAGRTSIQNKQRYIQLMIIVLAVGSLIVIMWLLMRWVIMPIDKLRQGMESVTDGRLSTRINVSGSTEIETISDGFNRMSSRLEDLVENLEAKVNEKTVAVEEKNRNLAQLYDMTSYFGRQHSVDELCDGFVTRLMQFTDASACAIFLLDEQRGIAELAANSDLPIRMFEELSLSPVQIDYAEHSWRMPLRVMREIDPNPASGLQADGAEVFCTAYMFGVKNGAKDIGYFVIYYRSNEFLSEQSQKLYESFGSHLGIAIDNIRLIDRDQQYAVVQERNLMAQGLHDSIAQSLSFLNLQVQLLENGLKSGDKEFVGDTVSQIKAGVQECYEDVRELLLNFRTRLHKESFAEGIKTVIERFEAQTKLKVKLVKRGHGPELTDKQKLQAIFIMQEALANVRKHSKADQVLITICNNEDFELTVNDNGCGIDPELVKQRGKRHVGLNIMRERSERIGSFVEVGPVSPDVYPSGTTVRLVIPERLRKEIH